MGSWDIIGKWFWLVWFLCLGRGLEESVAVRVDISREGRRGKGRCIRFINVAGSRLFGFLDFYFFLIFRREWRVFFQLKNERAYSLRGIYSPLMSLIIRMAKLFLTSPHLTSPRLDKFDRSLHPIPFHLHPHAREGKMRDGRGRRRGECSCLSFFVFVLV